MTKKQRARYQKGFRKDRPIPWIERKRVRDETRRILQELEREVMEVHYV